MGGHYNERGRYYEVLFKAECLKRGLCVLSPEHTHLAFDVAIFSAGKFITVQVKGTSVIRSTKGGREARFQCHGTANRVNYHQRGVDFIAAYVEPVAAWYIIPTFEVTGKTIGLRLGPEAKSATWRERWESLGAPPPA